LIHRLSVEDDGGEVVGRGSGLDPGRLDGLAEPVTGAGSDPVEPRQVGPAAIDQDPAESVDRVAAAMDAAARRADG
jgi:hypothetical protein